MRILLASKSPRRKELLNLAGFAFDIAESDFDEDSVRADSPRSLARNLAQYKAESIAKINKNSLVIGADTIVVLDLKDSKLGIVCGDSVVLGKPTDRQHAKQMLMLLSGREHKVITAYALICAEQNIKIIKDVETIVTFRKILDSELESYLDSAEPYDKAGAYGAQGFAQSFISSIRGSYTNVVGLPLSEIVMDIRGVLGK